MMCPVVVVVVLLILICSDSFARLHSRFHHIGVTENEPARHLLSLSSLDTSSSYQLVSTNNNLRRYFAIENRTRLMTLVALDRELLCREELCSCSKVCSIQLKLLSQPQHRITFVNITIHDVNDNPHRFRTNEIELRIPENTIVRHQQCYRVPTVEDDDLPETNKFFYELIGNGSERFEIDRTHLTSSTDLCLRVKNKPLDREERDRYEDLWLIASDTQHEQARLRIRIHVLDINDHSPDFLTNSTTIRVNETFTGKLTCVQAYDPDEGNNGRVVYALDRLDDKLVPYLSLHNETGCLSILQPLLLTSLDLFPLLKANNQLSLTVRAQDCGSRMSSTTPAYHPIELIIEDVNDHQPTIEVRQMIAGIDLVKNNSQIRVMENTLGPLAMVTVDDGDRGINGEIHLTLLAQTPIKRHKEAFHLRATSMKHYKIELVDPLDHELESSLVLFLDAVDGGGERTRFVLSLLIEDSNDMEPHFEHNHYHFITNIQSSTPSLDLPTIVGQVHAIDGDSSNVQLTYSLESTLFRIDAQSGELSLLGPLPVNLTDQSFIFPVNVSDGQHTSQTRVTISVEGLNHAPRFEHSRYEFRIDENVPIRTVVGQVIGTDEDARGSRRGELAYSLRSITPYSEFFFHTSQTGQVLVTRIPDAEQQQRHEFMITVRDHGTPPLYSEANLVITINDLNEYCPHLINVTSPLFVFLARQRLPKTHSPLFTHRLFAFDNDISDQSNITFALLSSPLSSLFHLDPTGLLTVNSLPASLPSIVELSYSLTDTFQPEPCVTRDTLVVLIGETQADEERLLDEYHRRSNDIQQRHRLATQKIANDRRQRQETVLVLSTFTLCALIVLVAMIIVTFFVCCRRRRRQRQRSIATKSSSLLSPSLDEGKQQSPQPFITDCNGKSSLLMSLR